MTISLSFSLPAGCDCSLLVSTQHLISFESLVLHKNFVPLHMCSPLHGMKNEILNFRPTGKVLELSSNVGYVSSTGRLP